MKQFLRLAFRNVFRNRRRTLMTLFMVAGGVAGLLLTGGFFSYMFWGLRETTIRNGLGHLQLFNAERFQKEETKALEFALDDYRELMKAAAGTPHVLGVAPRIEFFGMASNGQKSGTFMATAVDPKSEKQMGFDPRITEGRAFTIDGEPQGNEAVIGVGLARSMNVKPGDGLTLLAVTADGALNGIDVDIVGVTTVGIKEMDDRLLQITLPAAQQLLQTDRVTKIVVGLDKTENTDTAHKALSARLQGRQKYTVKTWSELATFYHQVRMMMGMIFMFLGVIVLFLVMMSSANTLMMAMFERTREIGMMLAMGTPRPWILALFLLEGLVTGIIGAGAGVLLGNGLGVLVNRANIQLPPPPGNNTGWTFHVLHDPTLMIAASVLVVLTLAVASVLPAVRASRLNIVQSLAHV